MVKHGKILVHNPARDGYLSYCSGKLRSNLLTGLSDMKLFHAEQKHDTAFYQNFKYSVNGNFSKHLNNKF